MKMDMFLNDNYKILKLMYNNQAIVLNENIVPLTQAKICSELKMSKMKVNAIFVEFQKEQFLIQETRGKYSLTDKARFVVESIEKISMVQEG